MDYPGLATLTVAGFHWILNAIKSPPFWFGAGIVFLIIVIVLRRRHFHVSTATLSLPFNLGNITYQATEQDRVFAWKLYVHLKTRKAALPFDHENDVIVEVYDSLYELFQITRDLLCSIPIENVQGKKNIADLILRVQNDGLRPHLTKWQAPFRRWWTKAVELPDNRDKSPQEIQKQFKDYEGLLNDLRQMNTEMSKFAEQLLRVVRPQKFSGFKRVLNRWKEVKTVPLEPSSSSAQSCDLVTESRPPEVRL
jgi:hypothetical protein